MAYYPGATEAIRLGNAQNAGYDTGYRQGAEDAQSHAEQACRYMLKHQGFPQWDDASDYERGFMTACGCCERAIGEHIKRKQGRLENKGFDDER